MSLFDMCPRSDSKYNSHGGQLILRGEAAVWQPPIGRSKYAMWHLPIGRSKRAANRIVTCGRLLLVTQKAQPIERRLAAASCWLPKKRSQWEGATRQPPIGHPKSAAYGKAPCAVSYWPPKTCSQ